MILVVLLLLHCGLTVGFKVPKPISVWLCSFNNIFSRSFIKKIAAAVIQTCVVINDVQLQP